jgi:hypothetical protein
VIYDRFRSKRIIRVQFTFSGKQEVRGEEGVLKQQIIIYLLQYKWEYYHHLGAGFSVHKGNI